MSGNAAPVTRSCLARTRRGGYTTTTR